MNLVRLLPGIELAWSALPLSVAVYVLLLIDARRKGSEAQADDQLGVKTVAAALVLVSTVLLATGLRDLLHLLLTFDDFGDRIKVALPSVLVGGLGVAGSALVLFPRTNAHEFPKAKRLAAGIIALGSGIAVPPALAGFIAVVLDWPSWDRVADALATTIDALVIFGGSFMVLGKLSGIVKPTSSGPALAGPPPGPASAPGQAMPGPAYPGQVYPGQAPGVVPPGGAPMPGQAPGGAPMPGQAPVLGQAPGGAPMPGQAPGGAPMPGQVPVPGQAPAGAPMPGQAPAGAPMPGQAPGAAPMPGPGQAFPGQPPSPGGPGGWPQS